MRLMRKDNAAIHAGKEIEANLLKSPAQVLAEESDSDQKSAIRAGIMAQLKATPT